VFDQLIELDDTGMSWVSRLLRLPSLRGETRLTPGDCGCLRDYHWNREDLTLREVRLDPPRELLRRLVANPTPGIIEGKMSDATRAKRQALLEGDPGVVAEALALLEQSPLPVRKWYVLEGRSQPDAYVETDECTIVIEGKRTEPRPTRHTSAMSGRHQMLRHIDCAWSAREGKSVFGFFAVSGGRTADDIEVPAQWVDAAASTIGGSALTASLPHRTEAERGSIASCFLGVTTWQAICAEFELDWGRLPDTTVGPAG
jgi:hypothetical protein